jgi:integrase
VGWLIEAGHLYLDPDAAYAAAQKLGQEVGDRLGVTPHTLRRRLKEAGLLLSTDAVREVLTVRRVLEGQRRDVLHVSALTLSPPSSGPGLGRGVN